MDRTTVQLLVWLADTTHNILLLATTCLLPLGLLCILLYFLGKFINRRMYRSFGWSGVLATAWIGTPVHEYSHYLACVLARHKVVDFALFKPDARNLSLGWVDHAYDPKSFYQRIPGNFIVSLAPFVGGSLVIYLVSWKLYPQLLDTGPAVFEFPRETFGALSQFYGALLKSAGRFMMELGRAAHSLDFEFFFYLYVLLSVGSHLSPSPSDLKSAWWPAAVLSLALLAICFILAAMGWLSPAIWQGIGNFCFQIQTLLTGALLFVTFGAGVVWLLTTLWNRLFGEKPPERG